MKPEMKIRVDDDINSYKGFFDHQWAKQFKLLVESTKLSDAAFNLCAEWKGISNARSLPWLMIGGMVDTVDSALNSHIPLPVKVIQDLVKKIEDRMETHRISLSTQDRTALCSEIKIIETQTIKKLRDNPLRGDVNQLWTTYLKNQEFLLAIWMSETNAFRSIYFAYENFLIKTIEVATGKQGLRANDLECELRELFSENIFQKCWKDVSIDLPRLIRHSLVHNGFKPTGELGSKYKGKFHVEGGKIVIMAYHTNQLFNSMKEKILVFAKEAVKLDSLKPRID